MLNMLLEVKDAERDDGKGDDNEMMKAGAKWEIKVVCGYDR